jgi:hypothetical protein
LVLKIRAAAQKHARPSVIDFENDNHWLRSHTRLRLSLLAAHRKGQNKQSWHRERIVLIYEASRAQLCDNCRIVISQAAAAKQLDQRALLKSR